MCCQVHCEGYRLLLTRFAVSKKPASHGSGQEASVRQAEQNSSFARALQSLLASSSPIVPLLPPLPPPPLLHTPPSCSEVVISGRY